MKNMFEMCRIERENENKRGKKLRKKKTDEWNLFEKNFSFSWSKRLISDPQSDVLATHTHTHTSKKKFKFGKNLYRSFIV